jgi:hypothetical protein
VSVADRQERILRATAEQAGAYLKQAKYWREEAQRYAQNADYWRRRAERVEAAARRADRWEHAHDCGELGPSLATRACTCGLEKLRAALADAPGEEGSGGA